ncbi:glycosyl hydrolase family 95 catalytic domain-containing protein [Aestuariivivens marinum]|uniref:glycosyl hydrolase family 95 catalytic domain-containing protein n=1 Tax=Aestuariivivens marinum TaxID=2913555 RepID=UPI001F5A060F|nr:hypothetical protein [Aestuariivivens marinum]
MKGSFRIKGIISVFLVGMLMTCSAQSVKEWPAGGVPYPEMLEQAKITLNKLDSASEDAVIQGNGDLHSILYAKENQIVLRLAKNDVYDARIDTKEDKELARIDIKTGRTSRELDLPPSWNKPYPLSINFANVEIDYSGSQQTTIDVFRANANINGGEIIVRALLQDNVYYIKTARNLKLKAQPWEPIPPALTGSNDGVQWVKQDLPPDESGDWKGMQVVTAMASKGENHYIAVVSSVEVENPLDKAIALAKQYVQKEEVAVVEKHEGLWYNYWQASGIKLSDLELSKVWYRNLYFARCAQNPKSQAIGLFIGPLLQPLDGWHDNYTINYNFQQTFWSFLNTNHVEFINPYNKVVLDYLPRAQWFAKQTYGVEGAFYPHNIYRHEPVNPEECKSNNNRMFAGGPWAYTLGLSGFLMHNLWLSYKYCPTQEKLNKIYPAIREMARFYAAFCEKCEFDAEGNLILGPTVSPEHMPFGVYNCPFDIAFMKLMFEGFLEASEQLNKDLELAQKVRKHLNILPPYPVDKESGYLVDRNSGKPLEYNIPVPSTPVFPAEQITFFSPEQEKELFIHTLQNIKTNGNNSTIMLAVSKARLSTPDARLWLQEQIELRTKPNGSLRLSRQWAPFNNFGHYTEMFAVSGAISELLLQSVDSIIRLFPAWPKDEDAKFEALRAIGGFLVFAEQKNGKIMDIQIISTLGGDLYLFSPWKSIECTSHNTGKLEILKVDPFGIIHLSTKQGESYSFKEAK